MLDGRMKELCRICARELCGNQRRWIFHPASKLNLQVLLSHVLGRELTRDGRSEFACGKCVFMLERMYRFDTVIARVEALSIERLQRLLQEKERLRQCIGSLYGKTNGEGPGGSGDCTLDMSDMTVAKYCALLREDFVYSAYESWAEDEDQTLEAHHHHHHCRLSEVSGYRSRRCKGCANLRVADSDYEAVCRVPRKLARSISCGPSTRYSLSALGSEFGEEPSAAVTPMPEGKAAMDNGSRGGVSPASSLESLDAQAREEEHQREPREELKPDSPIEDRNGAFGKLALAFSLVKDFEYRPVQSQRGSKLPVLVKPIHSEHTSKEVDLVPRMRCNRCCGPLPRLPDAGTPHVLLDLPLELAEPDDLWQDVYTEYMPFRIRKSLVEEQQTQLNRYECAAGQCVSELQKAQLQVQSLQARIHKSETDNKKLQEKLCEMESELRAVRQASQQQERTIQGLRETAGTKEREAQELYSVIEGQKDMLCKLREVAQRHQLQHLQVSDRDMAQLQRELLTLQGSLFSTQLELQGSQRAERRSQWRTADAVRDRDRLQADLEEALQQRAAAERHNQELRGALQRVRSELRVKEGQLKEVESEKQAEVATKEKTIQQLRISLRNKEQLAQEYLGLLDQQGPGKTLDTLLHKMKERIKERDVALERAIDDKFRCLEEKDADTRRLQLALREKERDLERLRYVLSKNEETITSLEGVLRAKELEMEQVREANRKLQWLKQEEEERRERSLTERDAIIGQLQASLQSRAKEAEDLTAALLSKVTVDSQDAVEELQLRLQLKELLFQEALSDRARQAQEHHTQVQDLLAAIGARDHYVLESVGRLGQVIVERTGELQELRRQLAEREQEVAELSQHGEQRALQPSLEVDRLQNQLREKDSFIRVLMSGTQYSQDEPMVTSKQEEPASSGHKACDSDSGLQADLHSVREELQLVLKKEQEAELELSALRATLAKDKEEILTLATELENHSRTLGVKEELIKDLQKQLVDPSELPLVEKLTRELQELRDQTGKPSSSDYQNELGQLVSDYRRLSEAVKMEKRAYESLVQAGTCGNSSEKTRDLQRELDLVQALRGQLEACLAKTQDAVVAPARAVKAQPDFGGGKQRSLGLRRE